MTWEERIARSLKKKDVRTIEDAYKDIIETSYKGREDVDGLFKLNNN